MSVITNTLSGIVGRAQNARQAVLSLACKIVEGGRVSAAEIDKVRIAADMSAVEFAELVERIDQRKLGAEFHDVGLLEKRLAEAVQASKAAGEELLVAQQELRDAHERLRKLHETQQRNLSLQQSYKQQIAEARQELSEHFDATGGGTAWNDVEV